ncbi:outer membrane beta-barrel protein [Mucilaginibacter corticis]|uniref:Outer membrane beta-barrel protein n=1 Tax=Mucilaginibacter corticis TaxID=2597670 RepID=A0A556MS84_9SPHI|nr:TonB-dependent receptor [Mucilaginibacter corticis]TSJ42658.1 outer membrane beta-barrel protein [Mucilaginibacter corticis]
MRTIPMSYANKLIVCILFSLFSAAAFAQSKASVSGKIVDSASKVPIEHATVAIVSAKDTSLISYTLTQSNGAFKLSGLPAGIETRLIVSAMGYTGYRKAFVFKPGETKNLETIPLPIRTLREIVIKGERVPVVIKKDTLEFSAEAFKTRPNAVVEDLLKLLPGVQINMDGSILINGKTVSKLLIDGKRFFGADPTIGTKNLDAELVDKVQIYDDREEDPDHKLTDLEVSKIINLKMKSKIKKSTIGKVYGGEGTRDRYEAGGIVSTFRDTLQISVIGLTNNLTRTGFSSSELSGMGGFNRSGGSTQYDGTFGGNGDGGIERMRSAGINLNNDYGKKLKTNFMYFYYNYVKDYNSKSLNEQNLSQTLLTTQNANINQLRQSRHTGSTLIEWAPDTVQKIRFEARLDISPTSSDANGTTNTFNSQIPNISNLFTKTSSISQVNEFTDNLLYYRKLKKPGASLTINQSLDLKNSGSDDYNFNNLQSFTTDVQSSLLDRYANTIGTYYVAQLSATYNYPFSKKVSNELLVQSRYFETSSKLSTFDKSADGNYDAFLDDQSNNQLRNHFIENVRNTVSIQIKKSMLKLGVDLELQQLTDNFHNTTTPTSTKYYNYLFPIIRFNAKDFSINYYEQANPPVFTQISPITQQISPTYTLTGNPNLTAGLERHLNFNYYSYNNDKQSYISMWANGTVASNNSVQVQTKDDNGFVTATYANKNGGWRAYMGIEGGKQYKKSQTWQVSLNTGAYGNYNQTAFYFNGDGGTQFNYGITAGQNIGINYKSIANLSTTYYLTANLTNYKGVDYPSVTFLHHTVTSVASVNWPKNLIFDLQYRYNYNPQIPAGFSRNINVLNMAETFMFLKQNRAQFKLSVYDLFDQNTSNYRYAANNSVTTGQNQILKRYFLLTFQYKINTIKK